jgi:hypothetical protein
MPFLGDVQNGLSLDSSALRSTSFPRLLRYYGFFATTASADFSQTLIREISPGKVLKLSARAAKLYLMRLSVTVGFRVP